MQDEELESRMVQWNSAEAAARRAERFAIDTPDGFSEAIQSSVHLAEQLRRMADAMLASILADVRALGPPPISWINVTRLPDLPV